MMTKIPRIDITSPANQIEYHPALLAHAEDNGGGEDGGTTNVNVIHMAQPQTPSVPFPSKPSPSVGKDVPSLVNDSDSDSDLSELSDGSLSDCTLDSSDSATDLQSMTPAEVAEHERFGEDYKGPILSDNHASRLLVLMAHASTCPCKHKLTKHRDVCKNTKYLMLHVRDCPGTTSTFDVCPFPWCRKVKHLLYHLVSCTDPKQCGICSPTNLSKSLQALVGLNGHRLQKYREQMIAATKVAATAKPSKGIPVIPKAGKRAVKMVPTTSAPSPQKQPDIQCLAPAKQETFSTPAQSYLPHPGAPENLKLHQHSVSAPGHSPQSQTHLPVPAPASAHAPPAASQPQATTIVATHVSVAMAHPPTATTQPGSQPEPTASIMLQPPVATTQQTVSQPQPMICQPTSQLPPATHNPETQLQPTGTQSQVAQTVQPPTSSQPVQPTVIAAAIHQASHQQPAVPQSGPAFIQSQNEVPAPVITAYQAAAVTQVAIQPQPIVAQLPIVTAQQDSAAPPAAIQPASKTQPVVTHSPVVTAQQVHPASRVQSVVVQPSVASQVQPVVTQPVVAAQQAALAVPPAAIQPASQVQPVVAKLPLVSTQQPLVVAQPATIQPASQAAVAQPSNQSQPVATQLQTAVVQPSIMATQQTSGAATSAPSGQPQSAPIQPSNVTPDAAAHQQIAHPQTATAQSVTTTQQTSVTTAPISLQPVTVADGDVVASQEVPGPAQPAPSGPRTAKVQPHSAATLPESQPPTVDTQLPVSTHEAPSATEPGQSQPASQLQALAHQSVTQPPSQQATSDPSKVTEPLSTQELNQSDAPSTVTTEQAAAQNTEGLNYPPVQANDGSAAGESITGSPATATSVVSATDESPSVQLAVSQPPSAVEPVATTATAKEIATPDAVVLLDQETDSAPPSPTTTTATATAANNTHHTAGKVEQTVEVN